MTAAPTRPQSIWTGHEVGSKEYRRLVWALLCAGIACFAALYAPQGVLPLVAQDLRVSEAQSALLVSTGTVGLAAGVLPWSWVADRIGRLTAMRVAMLASAVLGLAWIAFPGFEGMLVLRLLQGLALGGIPGLAITYLHDEVSPSHATVAAATYVSGTTLGGICGRMLAGPVAEVWGWRWGVALAWLVAALGSVAFVVLAPSARGFVRERGTRAAGVARNVAVNLRDPGMLALYAQAFLLMGGFVAVYNYLGFRLEAEPFGLSAGLTSLLFLAYLAGTFSSRKAGQLAGKLGRGRVLALSSGVMVLGIVLSLPDNLASIVIGLVVLTAGFFGAHAIASGWVGARAHTGRAQAASLYNLFYYLGSSVLGWVGGMFLAGWGWPGIVGLVIALIVTAGVVGLAGRRALTTAA
jgi:MFS transporter, YNFM family, putative membrane transport protein